MLLFATPRPLREVASEGSHTGQQYRWLPAKGPLAGGRHQTQVTTKRLLARTLEARPSLRRHLVFQLTLLPSSACAALCSASLLQATSTELWRSQEPPPLQGQARLAVVRSCSEVTSTLGHQMLGRLREVTARLGCGLRLSPRWQPMRQALPSDGCGGLHRHRKAHCSLPSTLLSSQTR